MPNEIYELIAQGARYWFLFLMLLIAWRSWRWYRKDKKQAKKRRKLLPDAGFIGELVVVQGGGPLERGAVLPVPREGTLGSGRGCDIRLRGLKRRHVNFAFVEGKGLLLTPCHSRSEILLNHEPLRKGGYALHGALIHMGGYTLRIRLFAGLNVPRAASYQERFQPVYGEDLYAPDPYGFTPVTPYQEAPLPYQEAEDLPPLYDMPESAPVYQHVPQPVYQPWPQEPIYTPADIPEEVEEEDDPLPFDTGMYAPQPPQEDDLIMTAAPRVRRRRSERNRNA